MDASLTGIVLVAALMHALWNALVKSSADRLIELTGLNAAAGVTALVALPFVGFPGAESLPYLLGTMLIHTIYYVLLLSSYARGGLSLVYPLARGSSPVFVAAAAGITVGERLSLMQGLGVGLIAISIVSLAFAGGVGTLGSRAVSYSLATGMSIAAYSLIDGAGARASASAASYIACLFVVNAFVLVPVAFVMRAGDAVARLRAQWKTAALGGVLSFLAYGLAIWAMTRGAIALVSALRETSVVLAAVIGATFLHEPFGARRVLASVGVACGVVVLRLAG